MPNCFAISFERFFIRVLKRKMHIRIFLEIFERLNNIGHVNGLNTFLKGSKVRFSETDPQKSGFGGEQNWLYLGVSYFSVLGKFALFRGSLLIVSEHYK